MRGRPPKRKNERFKAPTYSNGDTKLELLTRTKRALTQSREKWSDKTAERMKILFQEEPKLKEAYDIVNGLRSIFRSKTLDKEAAKVKLHDWYETATRCSLREIKSARDAIKSREDEVLNYFINHSTNAGAESLNSKIKTFRSQLRGVSDYTFFMYRIKESQDPFILTIYVSDVFSGDSEEKYIYQQHQNGYPGVGGSTPALYLFELDHDFKQEDRKAAYTPTVGYWVKECSKDKLVLERFEINTDGPNLLEGDVTFRRMGLYTK